VFKTPKSQRVTYVYTSATGAKVTLQPGENGVTEADIAALHRADDDEWNNDHQQHRSGRKTVTEIVSIDDVDKDSVWLRDENSKNPLEIVVSDEITQLALAQLSDKQAKAVQAVLLDGMSASDYAKLTGTSKANVSITLDRAKENLKKFFQSV